MTERPMTPCGTLRRSSWCVKGVYTIICVCCGARKYWNDRRTPQEAAGIMIHLNNKYGLDGRNPNSHSGIFWVLGRYDRPWGPTRPIYGTIRYMSSENTARKVR